MDFYLYFKAFHIIGFVSWFAGLFYLVRMFVYHAEVNLKPEALRSDWKKQFTLMQWRVFKIIATPGMIITWVFGIMMLIINPSLFDQNWIKTKLVLLVLLVVYHLYCRKIIKNQELEVSKISSLRLRLINEIPTLFLVSIVLLAVVKDLINFLKLFGGVLAFGVLLYVFTILYKKQRDKQNV